MHVRRDQHGGDGIGGVGGRSGRVGGDTVFRLPGDDPQRCGTILREALARGTPDASTIALTTATNIVRELIWGGGSIKG